MIIQKCDINRSDRINRSVIGIILLLGVLLGFGKAFSFILALVLIYEGVKGFCYLPSLVKKLEENDKIADILKKIFG
jgi:Protein of unknown function (DUF2892)